LEGRSGWFRQHHEIGDASFSIPNDAFGFSFKPGEFAGPGHFHIGAYTDSKLTEFFEFLYGLVRFFS
jgi:hypothetical protein